MKNFLCFMTIFVTTSLFADKGVVVYTKSGCDYFIVDGNNGFYLLEWYGGYSPDKGDNIIGKISSYGFKNVYYSNVKREGRVYVDDYMLSEDSAIEEFYDKCN